MKWSEPRHSWTSARLPAGELKAGWKAVSKGDPTGYTASAFGRNLKGLFNSLEEAKAAAERAALQLLQASIAELEDNDDLGFSLCHHCATNAGEADEVDKIQVERLDTEDNC
jgi:hypothetical protein